MESILQTFDQKNEDLIKVAQSSGRSIVYIYKDITIKVFPEDYNVSKETEILTNFDSKYIIKVFYGKDNIIVYNTVKPILFIKNPNILFKLLSNICIA